MTKMKQETTHRRLVVGMSSVFSRGQASIIWQVSKKTGLENFRS